eukprot:195751-Rhodomonas_salina.1
MMFCCVCLCVTCGCVRSQTRAVTCCHVPRGFKGWASGAVWAGRAFVLVQGLAFTRAGARVRSGKTSRRSKREEALMRERKEEGLGGRSEDGVRKRTRTGPGPSPSSIRYF